MKRVPKAFVECRASKDSTYRQKVSSVGKLEGQFYIFSDDDYAALSVVPKSDWPAWALFFETIRIETDSGVGDTVARLIARLGGDRFKSWFQKTFGKDCGCNDRQALLNSRYPYR